MTTTRIVAPGSSVLSEEHRDHYQERFGERYVAVQWQPQTPSRKQRRAQARRRKRR